MSVWWLNQGEHHHCLGASGIYFDRLMLPFHFAAAWIPFSLL